MAKRVTAKQLKGNTKSDTKVTIDGREYELSFNFGVLGELEEKYGDVNTALTKLQSGNIKAITAWIYANMILEDGNEDLTERKVSKMLDVNFINEIQGKMGKAMLNDFGENEEVNEEVGE